FLQFRRASRKILAVDFKTVKPEVGQGLHKALKHFASIKTAIYENFLPPMRLCIFVNLRCGPHNNSVKIQPVIIVRDYIAERSECFSHNARRTFMGPPQSV